MGADCKYCGAYISGDQPKCPACGKKIREPSFQEVIRDSKVSGVYKNSGTQAAAQQERAEQVTNRQSDWFDAQRKKQEDAFSRQRSRQNNATHQSSESHERQQQQDAREEQANAGYSQKTPLSFLCYLGILFIVPLLAEPKNEFVKFHSNQGLALFLAFIAVSLISWVPFTPILWLFLVYCFIRGLRNVSNGIMEPLPIIGRLKLIK